MSRSSGQRRTGGLSRYGVFEDFYKLYGRVELEAEPVEMVLGDGMVSW